MFVLKRLSPDAVPAALERAERYRLLNEPLDAESICEDVLAVTPGHQGALVMLLLALTDQFGERLGPALARARGVLTELEDPYSRHYYTGLVAERAAKAHLRRGGFASGHVAYELAREAMDAYEQAADLASAGNDEANLRWNTCARLIDSNPQMTPAPREREEPLLDARVDES
jgi:hypothetical protein